MTDIITHAKCETCGNEGEIGDTIHHPFRSSPFDGAIVCTYKTWGYYWGNEFVEDDDGPINFCGSYDVTGVRKP